MVREGEPASNRAVKIVIYPNKTQREFIDFNAKQVSRFVYNYTRRIQLEQYEEWNKVKKDFEKTLPEGLTEKERRNILGKEKSKYVKSPREISTIITAEIKNNPEFAWLKKADSYARCGAVCVHYDKAYKSFQSSSTFNKAKARIANKRKKGCKKKFQYPRDYSFPRYKKATDCNSYPTSIPVRNLDIDNHRVHIPKIGWVKYNKNQKIPPFMFPSVNLGNPIISTDGEKYYLSFGYYAPYKALDTKQSGIIGVDLGLKNLAVLSTGDVISNLADDPKVKKLNKKIDKLNKKISWLQEHSEVYYKAKGEQSNTEWSKNKWKISTKQVRKIQRKIKKLYNDINHYRMTKYHQICHEIIRKYNPEGIVFENLLIENMKKNKRLAPKIQKTGMGLFKQVLVWHARKCCIPCKEVDTFFPSSQICSGCKEKNPAMKDLKLRTFVCPHCGMVKDRDLNAAENLRNQWNNEKLKVI